ncbi:MAG: hypothetical protein PHU49_07950 [Syntrophorhabdaceae bacterium]|nr:hypothetical protein [Syntrophorhabdaceae bacterium]MDD5243936.1 hypothetical protein [Syntrophorhabdaceae bacterium]
MERKQKEPRGSVQTVLLEIENQLKLIRNGVYRFAQDDYLDGDPVDMLLGVHNTIQDIEAKIRFITADDRLDALPAPEGAW